LILVFCRSGELSGCAGPGSCAVSEGELDEPAAHAFRDCGDFRPA